MFPFKKKLPTKSPDTWIQKRMQNKFAFRSILRNYSDNFSRKAFYFMEDHPLTGPILMIILYSYTVKPFEVYWKYKNYRLMKKGRYLT